MRNTLVLAASALALGALLGGCVTEKRIRNHRGVPGTVVEDESGETSEERYANSVEWIEALTLEGVKEAQHRGKTVFLIKQLINNRPQSTEAVLAKGVTHSDPKVRENCAFFLGYAADRRAEEALMDLLNDPVEPVRLSAAASLVTGYDEKAGVAILLRALYSETPHYRREAVKNLRIYTQMYFAYKHNASRSERDFSAKKWEEWWRKNGDTFRSPVIGRPKPR